jgi:hypothetical protein
MTDDKSDKAPESTNGDKPAEAEGAAAPVRTRKIVRRSGTTRDNPSFTAVAEGAPISEAPASAAPASAPESATPSSAASAEGAPAPVSAPAASAPASAGDRSKVEVTHPSGPRSSGPPGARRFDARAPRPTGVPARPRRPRSEFGTPEARPMGSRPLPGGPRYPAPERRPRRDDEPQPAPMGSRPLPGGPRYPAPERPRRDDRDRPRRDDRGPRPPHREGPPSGQAPAAAKPAPSKPQMPPPPPSKPMPSKPKPVLVPLGALPQAKAFVKADKPAMTAKEALSAKAKAAQAGKPKAAPTTKTDEPAADKPAEKHSFDAALVSAAWDEAATALAKVGDKAHALIDAWVAASNGAAIAAAAEAEILASHVRKAARRALSVLKARGAAIPERARVAKLDDDRETVAIEATLLPPDAQGTIAISIASRDKGGRYHIAEVIIREPIGILQAGSGWLSGSQLKEARGRALERLGVAPVQVPVEWARHRVAEARKMNATSRQVLPLALDRCGELLEPLPAAAPTHPIADLEEKVTPERAAAASPGSAQLHNEPEFRSWFPDRGPLDDLLRSMGEKLGAESAQDPERVNAALKEATEEATDRFFSPEVRTVIAERMRDAAVSMRSRAGEARAIEVLAVARAVREAGLITSPPREVPFLVGFFQKALGVLASQGGGQIRVPVQSKEPAAPPAG